MSMTIAKRIQERLDALDMSARAASLAAGLSTHFLQQHLNPERSEGKSMRINSLHAIARVLKTTPEWLMTGIDAHVTPEASELMSIVSNKLDAQDTAEVLDFARYKASQNKTPE